MPEGHSIRHLANVFEETLVGEKVKVASPQGRFQAEADALNDKTLESVTAHGKHLFLHFGDDKNVHIHLGLYGWLYFDGDPATESTRMRIEGNGTAANLIAPTACQLWTDEQVEDKKLSLGPDPIHADSDPDRAWVKLKKSSKPIAALVMDQSVIAGIGNVYRAEILFMTKTMPFTPGKETTEAEFSEIWDLSRALLRDGSRDGKIRTVAKNHLYGDEVRLHGCAHFSYVYKRSEESCRICRSRVQQAPLAGRTLYWCPSCQS
ncbi:MAG: Fpg/Nei family DNA glycosylase [Betaproteobacteria bacterium]|nr:Fpg/Nei family DNA glycosylase [Betaproteobacteria bacterium]NCA23542.1 Fpg/Nei family DNA glycosylase [Betaproteobacteria bacterium]